ncbi:39006_t:CDS:2, partial [Gigaspora margarita]
MSFQLPGWSLQQQLQQKLNTPTPQQITRQLQIESQAQTPEQVEQIKEKAINDRDTKKAEKT